MSEHRTHCNCPPGKGYTYYPGEGWRNWCEERASSFAAYCWGCNSVCRSEGEGGPGDYTGGRDANQSVIQVV